MHDESMISKIIQIGQEAVCNAQEENIKKGISNNYVINGTHLRKFPDGKMSFKHNDKPYIVEPVPNKPYRFLIKDKQKELFKINVRKSLSFQDFLSFHGEETLNEFILSEAKVQLDLLGH